MDRQPMRPPLVTAIVPALAVPILVAGVFVVRGHLTARADDRFNLFVLGAVLVVAGLGLGVVLQQTRLGRRLAQQEREASVLRAAYETEKRVADTLQEAFLQKSLPAIGNVRFSAAYTPATEQARVGGDWYDALELSPERVLFAIGDVAGHGFEAAVAMSRARHEVISAAVRDPDPAALLLRANAELLRRHSPMVTVLCGQANARTYEFTYAAAGHPPPVLIEPGRAPRMLQTGGLPLAVLESASYRSYTVQAVPGAMLVLYTDGALEHSRDVLSGEDVLLEAIGRAVAGDAPDPAGAILQTIFAGRVVGDDVAILTVTFVPKERWAGDLPHPRRSLAT
jgi:serine phosphatase RsbU (regulator of sigma subunit)